MRIGQTSFVYFLADVGTSVVGFLATVYLTRHVADSVLGTYFLAVAVLIWLTVLLGGTVQSGVTKRLSENGDLGYVSAGAVLQAVLFVVSGGVLWLARPVVDGYIGAEVTPLLVGLLAAGLALSFVSGILKGQHDVHVAALLRPVDRGVRSVLQVAAAALGFGLVGLLAGYGVAALVAAAVGAVYASVRVARPTRTHIEHLLAYVRYSWLERASSRAFASMDTLVLGAFVAPNLIAYYEIAWNLASLLAIFGVAIAETMFPEMSRLTSGGDEEQVRGLVEDALAFGGLFLVPGLFGSYLIGARVLRIYESAYTQAATILVVLVAARLVYAYQSQLSTALNGIDRPDLAFRVNGLFFGVNIVLNVLLVWRFGWIGAAVATAISTAAALALGYRYLDALIGVRVPVRELARQWIAAAAMAVVVYMAQQVLPTGLPATLVLVGIGGAVYLGVLTSISSRFRNTVIRNFPI